MIQQPFNRRAKGKEKSRTTMFGSFYSAQILFTIGFFCDSSINLHSQSAIFAFSVSAQAQRFILSRSESVASR
jgi:hypothetical protein